VASKTNPDTHPLSGAETHPGIIQALLDLAWGNRWCANKWFERSLRGRRSPGLPRNSLPESVQQAMRQRSSEFVRRISQSATMPGESLARLPPRASTCATFCKASVPIAGRPHLGIIAAICAWNRVVRLVASFGISLPVAGDLLSPRLAQVLESMPNIPNAHRVKNYPTNQRIHFAERAPARRFSAPLRNNDRGRTAPLVSCLFEKVLSAN